MQFFKSDFLVQFFIKARDRYRHVYTITNYFILFVVLSYLGLYFFNLKGFNNFNAHDKKISSYKVININYKDILTEEYILERLQRASIKSFIKSIKKKCTNYKVNVKAETINIYLDEIKPDYIHFKENESFQKYEVKQSDKIKSFVFHKNIKQKNFSKPVFDYKKPSKINLIKEDQRPVPQVFCLDDSIDIKSVIKNLDKCKKRGKIIALAHLYKNTWNIIYDQDCKSNFYYFGYQKVKYNEMTNKNTIIQIDIDKLSEGDFLNIDILIDKYKEINYLDYRRPHKFIRIVLSEKKASNQYKKDKIIKSKNKESKVEK